MTLVILLVCFMHLWWALMLFLDERAAYTTAIDAMTRHGLGIELWASLLAVAAVASIWAVLIKETHQRTSLVLLLPQQFLLFVSSVGVVEAIIGSHFADGVVRPQAFIAADQIHAPVFFIGHTIAILWWALEGKWNQSLYRLRRSASQRLPPSLASWLIGANKSPTDT